MRATLGTNTRPKLRNSGRMRLPCLQVLDALDQEPPLGAINSLRCTLDVLGGVVGDLVQVLRSLRYFPIRRFCGMIRGVLAQ